MQCEFTSGVHEGRTLSTHKMCCIHEHMRTLDACVLTGCARCGDSVRAASANNGRNSEVTSDGLDYWVFL